MSRYVSFSVSMGYYEARAILAGLKLDANPDTKDWRNRVEQMLREHDENEAKEARHG